MIESLGHKVGQSWASLLPGLHYDPIARASRLSGPLALQVQTVDRCNATCPACPYRAPAGGHAPPRLMPEGLYLRILDGARRAGSVLTFVLMLQNEPLLDPDLAQRVRQARHSLGRRTRVITVTNGSLLTTSRVGQLVDAGLDEVCVSIDAVSEETYRAVRRGPKFARVVENVHALLRRRGRTRVVVRFLRQRANEGEQRQFVRHWRSRGARVETLPMSNRAGTLARFAQLRRRQRGALRSGLGRLRARFALACTRPFLHLAILTDGRVLVCCDDWAHRVIVGDLSRQSLSEVWNGDPINHHRQLLWTRQYDQSPLCRNCSDVRDPC